MIGSSVEISKKTELHKSVIILKSWLIEQTFSWLEKRRKLWKNCERKLNTSFYMVILAFIRLFF